MQRLLSCRFLLVLALICCSTRIIAQDTIVGKDSLSAGDTTDIYDMSLDQLQSLKGVGAASEFEQLINSLINVSSRRPLSARESPNIISLVTEEEIKRSGARDLMDVLNLIPGMDFGMDVEGVVGLGMRGNWVHEGKLLLLIDGQEMNELLFGTTQFGNHYPIDQIKRIEIVRGPGSAVYGGYAEYGVINIITKNGEDLKGINAGISYGQMKETYGRKMYSIAAGNKWKDLQASLAVSGGAGNRSDRTFSDFYGGSLNLAKNSSLDPFNINAKLEWKDLRIVLMQDNYSIITGDGYDQVKNPYNQRFNSTFAEIKYNFVLNNKWSVIPKLNFKRQVPWQTPADSTTAEYYRTVDRYSGNLVFSYNFTRKINLVFGGEVFADKATDHADSSMFSNGSTQVNYLNEAAFLQGVFRFRLVNIIIGARFDHHSDYGSSFVPRIALTKRLNRFHFKLLYSDAFRPPSIENINLKDSSGMVPEKTSVAELEIGYQLGRKSLVTVNIFDITTRQAIVYYYDPVTLEDRYHNAGGSGSRGVELEYKVKDKWGFLNFNYAYYSVAEKARIPDYEVPSDKRVLMAFPAHKINFSAGISVTKNLMISPSILWRGARYAWTGVDSLGNSVEEKLGQSVYANIFLSYQNLFIRGLTAGAGVYNVFDEPVLYVQPYNSQHAPLPGPSREIVFRLSYTFSREK